MINTINSQDFRYSLFKFLHDNFCDKYFFSPVCGLGDRSTFYSLTEEFEKVHGVEVRILCFDGVDPVLDLFPNIRTRALVFPREAVLQPLNLTHWIYGANRPQANSIYFTWHRQYLDGDVALTWEKSGNEHLSHKKLIRHILGIPQNAEPQKISFEMACSEFKDCIIMSPIANSGSFSLEPFLQLASLFVQRGIRVLWNVGNAAALRPGHPETHLLEKILSHFSNPEILRCEIAQLLEICVEATNFTVSSRSGLCELLSLSGANYAVLQTDYNKTFWSLNDWGRPPLIWADPDLSDQDYIDQVLHG